MNTITFTATVTLHDDCEYMTHEELLQFAKWSMEHGAVLTVKKIEQQNNLINTTTKGEK